MATEAENSLNDLGAAALNLTQELKDAADQEKKRQDEIALGFIKLKNAMGQFTASTAANLQSQSKSMGKWSSSFTGLGDAAYDAGKNFGILGGALGGVIKVLGAMTGAVLKFNDNLNDNFDSLSDFGGSVGLTADGMKNLAHQADFTTASMAKFTEQAASIGAGLLTLGKGVAGGVHVFAALVDQTDDQRIQMNKLGIDQEKYTKFVANHVKSISSMGLVQGKNFDYTNEESRKYVKTLTELSAITGEQRDRLQQAEQELALEAQFQVKYRELVESGRKEEADRLKNFIVGLSAKNKDLGTAAMDLAVNGQATTMKTAKLVLASGQTLGEAVTAVSTGSKKTYEAYRMVGDGILNTQQQFGSAVKLGMGSALEITGGLVKTGGELSQATQTTAKQIEDSANRTGDGAKDAQGAMMNAQLAFGKAMDNLLATVAGPVNSALVKFYKILEEITHKMEDILRGITKWISKYFGDDPNERIYVRTSADDQFDKAKQELEDYKKKNPDAFTFFGSPKEGAADAKKYVDAFQKAGNERESVNAKRGEKAWQTRQQLQDQGYNFQTKSWSGGGGGAPPDAQALEGLNLKSKESTAGGGVDPRLLDLAKKIQGLYPNATFTALNDQYHKDKAPNSLHTQGKAVDFTLGYKPTTEQGREIIDRLKNLGFGKVFDEYNNPSGGATGGHIHAQLMNGGMALAGKKYLVGERGPEIFAPSESGRVISDPGGSGGGSGSDMGILSNKMDVMIQYLRSAALSQEDLVLQARNS